MMPPVLDVTSLACSNDALRALSDACRRVTRIARCGGRLSATLAPQTLENVTPACAPVTPELYQLPAHGSPKRVTVRPAEWPSMGGTFAAADWPQGDFLTQPSAIENTSADIRGGRTAAAREIRPNCSYATVWSARPHPRPTRRRRGSPLPRMRSRTRSGREPPPISDYRTR